MSRNWKIKFSKLIKMHQDNSLKERASVCPKEQKTIAVFTVTFQKYCPVQLCICKSEVWLGNVFGLKLAAVYLTQLRQS